MDEEEKKPERGRPPFVPSDIQKVIVASMKRLGETDKEICKVIIDPNSHKPISVNTLKKNFPEQLREGKKALCARLVHSLFLQGVKGNVKAIQILLIALSPEEWGFRKHLVKRDDGEGGETAPPLPSLTPAQMQELMTAIATGLLKI